MELSSARKRLFLTGLKLSHKKKTPRKPEAFFGRLAAFETACLLSGAGGRNRTADLFITNELLYQLSYTGTLSN